MLTALVLAVVLGGTALITRAVARAVDGVERRRLRRVAAEVQVTDAIHRALGPIVAPTVLLRAGRLAAVRMELGPGERLAAGRLAELAWLALDREAPGVRVVFVPRPR
jgi:hypothetical protein